MKKATLTIITLMLILVLALSACGVMKKEHKYTFGPSATQPETIDEFLPLFAGQVKRYNEIAPELWPGNEVVNIKVVIDDIDTSRLWLVSEDGKIQPLSEDEANKLGVDRIDRPDDWRFFAPPSDDTASDSPVVEEADTDGNGGIQGEYKAYTESDAPFKDGYLYFSVSQKSLSEREKWGRFPHKGMYSVAVSLIHESFHAYEQPKWKEPDIPINMEGDLALENTKAREKRDLLTRQLIKAVSNPSDRQLILEALATYQDYKNNFSNDYEKARYWDRLEGTAQYIDVLVSLMIYYPEQIKDKADLEAALAQLATDDIYHKDTGIVSEAYDIGLFSAILLDRLGVDWKKPLMDDPFATPLELLFLHFKGEALPDPMEITAEDSQEVAEEIRLKKEDIKNAMQMSIDMYEEEWKTADDERRKELEELIDYVKKEIEERTK